MQKHMNAVKGGGQLRPKNNAPATTKDSQSASIKKPSDYTVLALLLALLALLAFAGMEGWL